LNLELRRVPTDAEIELICDAAESAVRRYLESKISLKKISDLEVTVEALGEKPLTLSIDVAVELIAGGIEVEELVDKAIDAAFLAAESKIRELDLCKLPKN
jgi:hypothetical protein